MSGKIKLALKGGKKRGPYDAYELVPDSDGSGMLWFKETDEIVDIKERKLLDEIEIPYHGKCYDTGEYFSPAGKYAEQFLDRAPKRTEVMLYWWREFVGTRTFEGVAHAKYYSTKRKPK